MSLSADDEAKLADVDPALADITRAVGAVMPVKVIEGHRGKAAQDKAFAEGKSKLRWPSGKHNALPSMAVDLAPLYYEGGAKIDWGDVVAFGRIMGAMQMEADRRGVRLRFGLDWDGDFRSVGRDPDEKFLDAPHVERVTQEVS